MKTSTTPHEKLRNILKMSLAFDLEAAGREIDNLHAARKTRTLSHRDHLSVTELVNASMQEASYRSRIVEIMTQAKRHLAHIEAAVAAVKAYELSNVTEMQNNGLKTQADKTAFINRRISNSLTRIREFESVITTAQDIIHDIDQAAWTLKRIQELYELATRPEMNL